jgi:hypothetical protein
MSYIILRGHWCNIIILNVHAPSEDKSNDVKDSFYEKLGHVFHQLPRHDIKILLSDFNVKGDRKDTLKPTIWNEISQEISNDKGVKVVNFATSKNLVVKSTMFFHCNTHKHPWTSPEEKMLNHIDHVLMERRWHSSIFDV